MTLSENAGVICDWAKYYAGLGLRTLPLHPGSKKPLIAEWPAMAANNLQTVEHWWSQWPAANIGIAMGPQSGIIDIETDIKDDMRGEDSLASQGELPPTWSFRSGGGGIHRLFKCPGIHIRSRTGVLPCVDVRASGGYAVFPPSLHPNGNRYEWLPGCSPADMPEGPAVLPFHLLALLADQGSREPLRAPEEISEGSRNATLYKLACKLRNDGYEEPEIFATIWAVNENRCTPPLDQSEVELICRQAAKYKAGLLPQDSKSTGIQIQSVAQLQKKDLGDIHFVVVDLLPQGLSLLASPPKFGKSWFVLDLCLSAANGRRFLGHETHKCDCLYLALEDSERRLKYRMQKLLDGRTAPENFYYATSAPDIDNGLMEQLEDFVERFPQTGLIVIDTLQKVRGQNTRNESAYKYDYREMGLLKAFADRHGILVLLVHHLRKMKDDGDPHARISGTNGIMGAADTSLVLTKDKRTDKDTTLAVTGRDVNTSETVMQFDENTCRWVPVGNKESVAELRARAAYEINPTVRTIRTMVDRNGGRWKCKMSELLAAGREITGTELADSPRAMLAEVKRLDKLLFEIDGIYRHRPKNGSSGGSHHWFSRYPKEGGK